MRKQQGFTMLEIGIVICILFLILPLIYLTAERLCAYHTKIGILNNLKQSAREMAVKIGREAKIHHHCTPTPDNHGIRIDAPGGAITYYLRDRALYRQAGGKTVKLSPYPVEDAIFILHGDTLIVNMILSCTNINTKKTQTFKFMESIDV